MDDENQGEADETNEEKVIVSDEVEISTRHYFSHTHIRSAALNAQQAAKYEEERGDFDEFNKEMSNPKLEHQAHVCSSVISSALFLEATVLELFSDMNHELAVDKKYDFNKPFVEMFQSLDKEFGRPFRRASTIQRYQLFLILAQQDTFHRGRNPCQNITDLLNIRNHLVHYEPEDVLVSSTKQSVNIRHTLVDKLQNKGVSENPFENGQSITQYLSHDCAEWSVNAALKFTDEFFSRLGEDAPYDHIRSEIVTDIS